MFISNIIQSILTDSLQNTKLGPGTYNIERHGTFSAESVARRASGSGSIACCTAFYVAWPGSYCTNIQ